MTTTPVRRLLHAIPALLLVLIPLRIAGQSAQPVQQQATASSWADEVLKQESAVRHRRCLREPRLAGWHALDWRRWRQGGRRRPRRWRCRVRAGVR